MIKYKSILIYALMLFMLSVNLIYADDFSDAIMKVKKKWKENTDNSEQGMLKIRGDFERILQLKKNQWLVDYYMGMVDMLISYQMGEKKDMDAVKKYTESSLDMLNN